LGKSFFVVSERFENFETWENPLITTKKSCQIKLFMKLIGKKNESVNRGCDDLSKEDIHESSSKFFS